MTLRSGWVRRVGIDQAPALVRAASGDGPAATCAYPGLAGGGEAVFEVGAGRHEFSGPDLDTAR